MKIVIFEGIATSGKTTIENLLKEKLTNAIVMSEDETLMGIVENKDATVALEHLKTLLKKIESTKADFLIIDRFHLTHAFRTGQRLEFFKIIEQELKNLNTLLVLLFVESDKIQERIEEATKIREGGWSKGKQGTLAERVDYYTNQQSELRELYVESALEKMIINTSDKDWGRYTSQVKEKLDIDVEKYWRDISNIPELTQKEISQLISQLPDKKAETKLSEHHLRLAYTIAKDVYDKQPLKNRDFLWHIQSANVALMECVTHPEKAMTIDEKLFREDFKAFVTRWIKTRFTQERSTRRVVVKP